MSALTVEKFRSAEASGYGRGLDPFGGAKQFGSAEPTKPKTHPPKSVFKARPVNDDNDAAEKTSGRKKLMHEWTTKADADYEQLRVLIFRNPRTQTLLAARRAKGEKMPNVFQGVKTEEEERARMSNRAAKKKMQRASMHGTGRVVAAGRRERHHFPSFFDEVTGAREQLVVLEHQSHANLPEDSPELIGSAMRTKALMLSAQGVRPFNAFLFCYLIASEPEPSWPSFVLQIE
jgi:hypothetical protein